MKAIIAALIICYDKYNVYLRVNALSKICKVLSIITLHLDRVVTNLCLVTYHNRAFSLFNYFRGGGSISQ